MTGRAIHSVLPAPLKEGTEVYAINEIPTSYSFVRRAGIRQYCPCTHSYSVSISYVCRPTMPCTYDCTRHAQTQRRPRVHNSIQSIELTIRCTPLYSTSYQDTMYNRSSAHVLATLRVDYANAQCRPMQWCTTAHQA